MRAVRVDAVTAPDGSYLAAVRRTLEDAEEAIVCVAFAQARGVHLIASELAEVAARGGARVVVTTSLGTSSAAALSAIRDCDAGLRVLNPGGATYHPKVFVGRRGDRVRAVVGSANLTSGLVANVEAGASLEGSSHHRSLSRLWSWAERVWHDPRGVAWEPDADAPREEAIEPELLAGLAAVARESPVVYTLGPSPRPNLVREVEASGLWVETARSRARSTTEGASSAQLVPPRMLNLAWEALRSRGRLTNRELLDELRVHRSSFVCAVLARLPGVEREPGREIALRYTLADRRS